MMSLPYFNADLFHYLKDTQIKIPELSLMGSVQPHRSHNQGIDKLFGRPST